MIRAAKISTLLGILTLVTLAPAAASADDGALYGRSGRDGVTFGLSLGGGHLGCAGEGCDAEFTEAGSFDLHIGGMLSPRGALLFEAWWMFHSEDNLTVSQGIMTGAFRFWPVRHFWLQGGLGVARAAYTYDGALIDVEDHTEWVPAFQVGVGFEPIATDTFGLDIALRYGTGFYSDGDDRVHNASLTLGVSFY